MIAQDADALRDLADYHRQARDSEDTALTWAIRHEEWMETLLDVADLLDRLARLVEPEPEPEPARWWHGPDPLGKDTADA